MKRIRKTLFHRIEKLDFTLNSWQSIPEPLTDIYAHSSMGYVSSTCVFDIYPNDDGKIFSFTSKLQSIFSKYSVDIGMFYVLFDHLNFSFIMFIHRVN